MPQETLRQFTPPPLIPDRRHPLVDEHGAALGARAGMLPKNHWVALVLGASDRYFFEVVTVFSNGYIVKLGAGAALHGTQGYLHASFGATAAFEVGVVAVGADEGVVRTHGNISRMKGPC